MAIKTWISQKMSWGAEKLGLVTRADPDPAAARDDEEAMEVDEGPHGAAAVEATPNVDELRRVTVHRSPAPGTSRVVDPNPCDVPLPPSSSQYSSSTCLLYTSDAADE